MKTFINTKDFEVDESLVFPDGQPHIKIVKDTTESDKKYISCRLTSSADILKLSMLKEIYDRTNTPVHLHIGYLLGARMDRPISNNEPFTLYAITKIINSLKFESVDIFCPHSSVSMKLIDRSTTNLFRESIFYDNVVIKSLMTVPELKELTEGNDGINNLRILDNFSIVYPDKGAAERMAATQFNVWYKNASRVILEKKREMSTGKILGMQVVSGEVKKYSIIIDDLCDGGATYRGAQQCLRELGTEKVFLGVCHGIFSKGLPIEGIDHITTTNSYKDWEKTDYLSVYKLF